MLSALLSSGKRHIAPPHVELGDHVAPAQARARERAAEVRATVTDIEASRATGEGLKRNLKVLSIEELDASEKRAKDVAACWPAACGPFRLKQVDVASGRLERRENGVERERDQRREKCEVCRFFSGMLSLTQLRPLCVDHADAACAGNARV